MERRGRGVVAVENDEAGAALVARSSRLRRRPRRASRCKGDATKLPSSQRFDRVLCDVPCSGDGALRKTGMRAYRRWRCADALALHDLQLRIALKGADLLKVGGRLVYSTCSLNPVENEAVVSRLLAARPDLALVDHGLGQVARAAGLATWRVLVDDHRGDSVAAASDAYALVRLPPWPAPMRAALPARRRPGGFSCGVCEDDVFCGGGCFADRASIEAVGRRAPLRLIDEDTWGGSVELDVRGTPVRAVGAARAARARGYSIELRPSSSAASWPRAWSSRAPE